MTPLKTGDQSPLPDSSALEAGLLMDNNALGTGELQADVRQLLSQRPLSGRLVYADVCRSPRQPPQETRPCTTEAACKSVFEEYATVDQKLSTPIGDGGYATSLLEYYSVSPRFDVEAGTGLFPPYDATKEKLPAIAYHRRHKRHRKSGRRHRCRLLICISLACLLATLVALYTSQAVPPRVLHPALHTVFSVSILLTSLLIIYYALPLIPEDPTPRHLWAVRSQGQRLPHYRRHRHYHRMRPSDSIMRSPLVSHHEPKSVRLTSTKYAISPRLNGGAAVVDQSGATRLTTPPAARTARQSTAALLVQDMKPLSKPSGPTVSIRSPAVVLAEAQRPAPLFRVTVSPTRTREQDEGESLRPTVYNPVHASTMGQQRAVEQDGETEEGSILISAPPPAYGRWRGSVRIDPDLLSWAGLTLEDVQGAGAAR